MAKEGNLSLLRSVRIMFILSYYLHSNEQVAGMLCSESSCFCLEYKEYIYTKIQNTETQLRLINYN